VDDQDRAIVFFHGIFGDPKSTFAEWPAIIASDVTPLPDHGRVADLAVYSVDYVAYFKTKAKLDDVAIAVAADLASSSVFRRHRHVFFVAHSMGGLVLERTLLYWRQQGKDVLIDRVQGVALLGVPSSGSPLADLASKYRAGPVAGWLGWDSNLLTDLTSNGGSYLDSVESGWEAFRDQRQKDDRTRFTPLVRCAFEEKPQVSLVDVSYVVPKLYASTACVDRLGFPVTHIDLVKPKDQNDSIHIWLRDLLVRAIVLSFKEPRDELTTAPPPVVMATPVPQNLLGRVNFLKQASDPDNLDAATGLPREPESIDWADKDSASRAETLVLRGGPFIGPTITDVLLKAAKANTCLTVMPSKNRLSLKIAVTAGVRKCEGLATVCDDLACK
jgi:pimeloyl-ACP methyl ester carboxylesterase